MANMRLEGGERLNLAFKVLPRRMRRKINRQAVLAGARIIAKGIKEEAPRRPGRIGGTLRKSIKPLRDRKSRGRAVVRYNIGPTKDGFYGLFLELGLGNIQVPKPFVEPGFEKTKRRALKKLQEIWGNGIQREMGKLTNPPQRER